MPESPFRALGLDADPGLSDDDVRAAWHRVAAATHPDRADGGDPAAFSAAAAAYSDLRTPFGRGEALAGQARRSAPGWHWTARLRGGRPVRLAALVAGGAGVSVLAVIIDGWQPASVALIAGAATWVLTSARRYLGAGPAAAGPPPADRAAGSGAPPSGRAAGSGPGIPPG